MKKSTSAPVLQPIQFRCNILMPSDQSVPIEVLFQAIGIGGDSQHPLPQRRLGQPDAPLSLLPHDFLVGQHGPQLRTPIDPEPRA